MSSTASNQSGITAYHRFKIFRRRYVKKFGKNLIRGLADFLGRQSLVGDMPVHKLSDFPDVLPLQENWKEIRGELAGILKHREAVPTFQAVSPDQMKISKGDNWRTFILYGFGNKLERNCLQAPKTAALLEKVPNLQTAWFSILGPQYHIPEHRGVTKGILRCHVGLVIPKDAENCKIRIADEYIVWREGEAFVFDDTYRHEVWNDTDEERVVLLFDFNRPMRIWGRIVNASFVALMKLTAFYQEPKKNMKTFEDRFEAATKRADANLEKLSD